MPLTQDKQAPPSPTAVGPKERRPSCESNHTDIEGLEAPPMSPRVRRRLDDAKENASLFGPVCEQGEVIQWMSACHPDLIGFGRSLEQRGYRTLSSIAFLTEDELDSDISPELRAHLLTTLAKLRHEFFRM